MKIDEKFIINKVNQGNVCEMCVNLCDLYHANELKRENSCHLISRAFIGFAIN